MILPVSQQLSKVDPKRVYYLSLEFLLGRSMDNALLNMGLKDKYGSKSPLSSLSVVHQKEKKRKKQRWHLRWSVVSGLEYEQCE